MKKLFALLLWSCWLLAGPAQAQPEIYNWRYGQRMGLQFGSNPAVLPTLLRYPVSTMLSYEACSAISDSLGTLQCYTNGQQVWDRTNMLMPNGQLNNRTGFWGTISSATQGALLVPDPGRARQYYLFTVDAAEYNLVNGLQYSLIDMRLRGGLGDVVASRKTVPVPPVGGSSQLLAEKLTAVRHANGRDYWILVHGWNTADFYAYLLTPAGLSATPVVSTVGSVHADNVPGATYGGAVGYLRASADGRRLAASIWLSIELFDFDKATGQLTNPQLMAPPTPWGQALYGVEFSRDGSKVYSSAPFMFGGAYLVQFDLRNSFAPTVWPWPTEGAVNAIVRGPDDRLYITSQGVEEVSVVDEPNRAGTASGFRYAALGFTSGSSHNTRSLPNFPNDLYRLRAELRLSGPARVCAGGSFSFAGELHTASPVAGSTFAWDFGEPAAGAGNAATGPTASHRYAVPGTYTVTLTATSPVGQQATATQTITVDPLPAPGLSPRAAQLCPGNELTLSLAAQPAGSRVRWADGSTAATRRVHQPGRYVVQVTSAQGCTALDSVEVLAAPAPQLDLGPDQALCAGSSLRLRAGTQAPGSTFRWQDGSTTPELLATEPGRYWLTVTSPAGCTTADTVLLRRAALPTLPLPVRLSTCDDALLDAGAQPAGSSYRWQDGSTGRTFRAAATGTYTVQVTNAEGCSTQASTYVERAEPPTVSLGPDTTLCPGTTRELRPTPQPAGSTYSWQDGSTAPRYQATAPGTYTVEVRTAAGCTARSHVELLPADCAVLIPNVITPNNDGLNDYFAPQHLAAGDWSLTVFDRWGRQVWQRARYTGEWSAEGLAAGLYYYQLMHARTGQRYKGWVEVLR